MKYIGIPTCPYCKKRVNLLRVWSLKKHGEFMCPRCKGISNIYLSPFVYLIAFLAIAISFLIYFFSRFILENLTLVTPIYVFIPFAAFFLLSLFMVYLQKPVIKKIKKTSDGRYFDSMGKEYVMRVGRLVPLRVTSSKNKLPQRPQNVNDEDIFNSINNENDTVKTQADTPQKANTDTVYNDLFNNINSK